MSTTMDGSSVTTTSASATNYWGTFQYDFPDIEDPDFFQLEPCDIGETVISHLLYGAEGYYPDIEAPYIGTYAVFVWSRDRFRVDCKDPVNREAFVFLGFYGPDDTIFVMPSSNIYIMYTRIS